MQAKLHIGVAKLHMMYVEKLHMIGVAILHNTAAGQTYTLKSYGGSSLSIVINIDDSRTIAHVLNLLPDAHFLCFYFDFVDYAST